jgi:hypothetical protein
VGLLTVLLINQRYFPNSKYADLVSTLFSAKILAVLYFGFVTASVIAITLAVFSALCFTLQRAGKGARVGMVCAVILLLSAGLFYHQREATPFVDAATASKPNIILIGADSLRPDYVGYLGSSLVTPNLDAFLRNSTVFMEALTPIARTFPAWVSILTGQYPRQHGVRFDLMDVTGLDLHGTLSSILRDAGYETVFATDDTRFSNIDERFGFDKVVTPPRGLNDFLLGSFNDFPLSNIVVNTRLGRWLFPYSYANRPAFITYNPASFLELLKPVLATSHAKPLFLTVHFCLPHSPYYWSNFITQDPTDGVGHYQAAIQRFDQQLQAFLAELKQYHLLDHSIVVLLSDHGEALELPGDRITASRLYQPGKDNPQGAVPHFYPPSLENEAVNESVGHGTDVLSMSQYHALLAFRLYGVAHQDVRWVSGIVSLLDIKPTLFSYLGLPLTASNGKSLRPVLDGKSGVASLPTDLFIESDFSPQAIHSAHPETRQLLFEGIDFFEIHPVTTLLTVKQTMAPLIISSKQYADIYGAWILALYPDGRDTMTPVLVNLATGKWTTDLRIPFAQQSPAAHMLQALKAFYGQEIRFVRNI